MNTVLVIDDNEDYRTGLKEVLEFQTYRTLEAENGLIGLKMMQQHSPDLVVCDVHMPVMNGIELLRKVKADPLLAKIPFVMITGQSDERTLQTTHDLGVEAYLTKPVTITEFLSTVDHFLNT